MYNQCVYQRIHHDITTHNDTVSKALNIIVDAIVSNGSPDIDLISRTPAEFESSSHSPLSLESSIASEGRVSYNAHPPCLKPTPPKR